jgi:hypothetical protein
LSAGSLRTAMTWPFLTVPSVLVRALSIAGRVATAFLVGERGFAPLEGTSGFATRLVTISTPAAEASADLGCIFLAGTPSLTVTARFVRIEGSVFCVVLGLSAWVMIPGGLGFEDFGAKAIAGGWWSWSGVVVGNGSSRCTYAKLGKQVTTLDVALSPLFSRHRPRRQQGRLAVLEDD